MFVLAAVTPETKSDSPTDMISRFPVLAVAFHLLYAYIWFRCDKMHSNGAIAALFVSPVAFLIEYACFPHR